MSDTVGPILYKCPYCSTGFRGKYDFPVAELHIRTKHPRALSARSERSKKDPYDFLGGMDPTVEMALES